MDVPGLCLFFGVIVPSLAVVSFFGGFAWKAIGWARSPVPFHIPITCGQQRSLPWIRSNRLDNPHTPMGAALRVALAVLLFRPLLRNTMTEIYAGPKLTYAPSRWLWLFAVMFHWSMLVIVLRHLRLFVEPVPAWVLTLQRFDRFFEVGHPVIHASTVLFVLGLGLLLLRRLSSPQLRYISILNDYFPLFLLLGIGATGTLLRHYSNSDAAAIKEFVMGLVTLSPLAVSGIPALFYVHLFLVSVLLAYFPWSKLMHMPGVLMSPTLNLANNSRAVRHVNPWNPPVGVHSYAEYEDEFRGRMIEAGLPVDKL